MEHDNAIELIKVLKEHNALLKEQNKILENITDEIIFISKEKL